ncbi:MAG: 4-hydroxy-3-methylbut-2-enyl diphosphate reductase, partial [Thermoanaerobaculia bacterium]
MKVKRAEKYGFCSGVRIADLKVKRFAAAGGRGAILGQVVHNERVVQEMENLGVRTVDEISGVTEPTIVFSAHGVPPSFHDQAKG